MLKLLIVDDERIIREGVTRLLTTQGQIPVEVRSAASGQEGLEVAAVWRPDVALVDINMPEMDGFAFIDRAKESLRLGSCHFVVLTGYDEYHYAIQALRRQVADYLLKPVDAGELLGLLARLEADQRRTFEKTSRRLLRDLKANMVYQEPLGALETELDELRGIFGGTHLAVMLAAGERQAVLPRQEALRQALASILDIAPQDLTVLGLPTAQGGVFLVSTPCPVGSSRLEQAQESCLPGGKEPGWGTWAQEPLPGALSRLSVLYLEAWKCMLAVSLESPPPDFQPEEEACARILPYETIADWQEPEVARRGVARAAQALESLSPWGYRRGFVHLCAALALREWQESQSPVFHQQDILARLRLGTNPISREDFVSWSLQAIEEAGEREAGGGDGGYSPNVQQALAYIRQHFDSLQSIDEVAARIHLHPNYLSTLLKKETGTSFVPFLNALRVDRAKQLLLADPEHTVEWVAEEVGFQTARYFYKVFKEATGVSPGRFRSASEPAI